MSEQIEKFVSEVLAAETVEKAVEIYLAAPKPLRRAGYNQIREKNATLGKKIRAAAEERRGIAFRTQEGDLVLGREAITEQVVRLVGKAKEMDARKVILNERVVELKKQAQKFYGDDFLAELEGVIEQA
jgi:hypothetical protein